MKKFLFCFIVLVIGLASAQNAENFFSNESRFFSNTGVPDTFSLGFKKYDQLQSSLTLYNPTSMISSKYVSDGNGGYLRTNASDLPATLNGIPVDSFNPNGTTDLKSALGMGLLRTIFKL